MPGSPILYGTTHEFLDYINLKPVNELPTLVESRDIDPFNVELSVEDRNEAGANRRNASRPRTHAEG